MSGRENSLCKGPVSEGDMVLVGFERRPMHPEGKEQACSVGGESGWVGRDDLAGPWRPQ